MFIKSLIIRKGGTTGEIIREVKFRKGVNLIIDETDSNNSSETGNNVGKTTVLRLIDFCLGGDKAKIYQDQEFKGRNEEANKIKNFLEESEVYVEVILKKDLDNEEAEKITIGRNFLKHSKKIQTINNEEINNDYFPKKLFELIFNSQLEKPSFRQVICRNVRHSSEALNHTLKPLHSTVSNSEYEAIYLYWLGIASDSKKIEFTENFNKEKTYYKKVEDSQGDNLNTIKQKIITYDRQIEELNKQKEKFNLNENYTQDLEKLNQTKQIISGLRTKIVSLTMKRNLIFESQTELDKTSPNIEKKKVQLLYSEAKKLLPDLQKRFEDILLFHNNMIEEKKKFIGQELPQIDDELKKCEEQKNKLLEEEKSLSNKLQKTGALKELEKLIAQLTKQHGEKGSLEKIKELLEESQEKIETLSEKLAHISSQLKQKDKQIEEKIAEFNIFFNEKSQSLYGQSFLLSHQLAADNVQTNLKLTISGLEENPGTGGKRVEMIAFDLSYLEFAEKFEIPHLNFILHDQIENIHDNQINIVLLRLVQNINCQYIVPVLEDKLPSEVDAKKYSVLSLSQDSKLFKLP